MNSEETRMADHDTTPPEAGDPHEGAWCIEDLELLESLCEHCLPANDLDERDVESAFMLVYRGAARITYELGVLYLEATEAGRVVFEKLYGQAESKGG